MTNVFSKLVCLPNPNPHPACNSQPSCLMVTPTTWQWQGWLCQCTASKLPFSLGLSTIAPCLFHYMQCSVMLLCVCSLHVTFNSIIIHLWNKENLLNVCSINHIRLYLISGIEHDCACSYHISTQLLSPRGSMVSDQEAIVLCPHPCDRGMETIYHFKWPIDHTKENIVWKLMIKTVGIY